jgi:hypothetical protein
LTSTQVKPLPVTVGWLVSTDMLVRADTVKRMSVFAGGVNEAVENEVAPLMLFPNVKLLPAITAKALAGLSSIRNDVSNFFILFSYHHPTMMNICNIGVQPR